MRWAVPGKEIVLVGEQVLEQSGRVFEAAEIEQICSTVGLLPGLARHELALTLCEHLEWWTASGSAKQTACLKLLEKLEAAGRVHLPPKRRYRLTAEVGRGRSHGVHTDPGEPWSGTLRQAGSVSLEVVADRERKELFNEYVDRYHYLGYRRPFGCTLRYFVLGERGLLGCVLLAGAAKALAARDRWIGWGRAQRLRRLPWVVNNTRFLIFPWVRVRYLASHVLGRLRRRVRQDWAQRWGYRPVLLESFVDAQRYRGTCYRAAGWLELGRTRGQGLARPGREYTTSPKRIFVQPLVADFRAHLCSQQVAGESSR